MFTLQQIQEAHSKVKSGADFPAYVSDLKQLGLAGYVAFVSDGHTTYFGNNDFQITSSAKYESLEISSNLDKAQFVSELKAHQQGKTDFLTFCKDCAKSGINKWILDFNKMTCTYFGKDENEVLTEQIPQ
jgi:uncharacterized protein YbcV (DUF1398 family)